MCNLTSLPRADPSSLCGSQQDQRYSLIRQWNFRTAGATIAISDLAYSRHQVVKFLSQLWSARLLRRFLRQVHCGKFNGALRMKGARGFGRVKNRDAGAVAALAGVLRFVRVSTD